MGDAANRWQRLASPRHVREVAERMRAQLALGDDPRFTWLCDRSVIEAGRPKSWRPMILGELGRLARERGKDEMREVALQLCEAQPDTREAIRLIRLRRRAGSGEHPTLPLTDALLETVANFRRAHPAAGEEVVAAALDEALVVLFADRD